MSESAGRASRDVDIGHLRGLLQQPTRTTVAFVHGGAVDTLPVRARCTADAFLFGVARDAAASLRQAEVVLLLDGGSWWFELHGVSVRGIAAPAPAPEASELEWFSIAPTRVLAWDYGTIHVE